MATAGERVVALGWATPLQVMECGGDPAALVARGYVEPGPMYRLLKEIADEEVASTPLPGPPPASVVEAIGNSGRILNARYARVRAIRFGGASHMYLGWDKLAARWVALKILAPSEGWTVERFQREANLAGRLRHPNIATVFDSGTAGGLHYIAMEYVRGATLTESYATPGKLAILETVARAVHYAHRQGVIHRDLKPDNVMVEPSGRAVVVDFGLARGVERDGDMTRTGTMLGTPDYMAPEQVRGEVSAISPRTDVFALGAMLYELLTGVRPFAAPSMPKTYENILLKDPVPPKRVCPDVPSPLSDLCVWALQKDPQARCESAERFADEMRRPAGWVGRALQWTRRFSVRQKRDNP
jgi:serine/threonine-protein kinase